MHRIDKYSEHGSIVWPVWPNGSVFVYELSGSGFESSCSHKHGSLEFRLKKIDETRNYLFVEIKHGLMS